MARRRKVRRLRAPPVLTSFVLSARSSSFGAGSARSLPRRRPREAVPVRLKLVPKGGGRPSRRSSWASSPPGRTQGRAQPATPCPRAPTCCASRAAACARAARPAPPPSSPSSTSLPADRRFSFGGKGGRFGEPRPGRRHMGQDLPAAEGTPVVAPRGGEVEAVGYQARRSGQLRGARRPREDRDYVFMHLRTGSTACTRAAGAHRPAIGEVGNTGGPRPPPALRGLDPAAGTPPAATRSTRFRYLKSWDRYS